MGHIDNCLGTLRRLIAAADMNGIPIAENAIEEHWTATPPGRGRAVCVSNRFSLIALILLDLLLVRTSYQLISPSRMPATINVAAAANATLSTSILRRFDIAVISHYFPEFERELPRYLSQS